MKNVFKLIVLSAVRIFFKAKVLIAQLLVLVLLAVSILGTISLSNITLAASYENIAKNGNMADLTINNIPMNADVTYNIDGSDSTDESAWDGVKPSGETTVFNPLGKSVLVNHTDPDDDTFTGLMTTPGAGTGNLIHGSSDADYLSVNGGMPGSGAWLPYAEDVFSLYRNVIPVTATTVNGVTTDTPDTPNELFNPSVYVTDPFSFIYTNGKLTSMSPFGVARIAGFGSPSNPAMLVSHGVLDSRSGLVTGTSYSYNWGPNASPAIAPLSINLFASPSEFMTSVLPYPANATRSELATQMPPQLYKFYEQNGAADDILTDINQFINKIDSSAMEATVPLYTFTYSLVPNPNPNVGATGDETANSEVNFVYDHIFTNGKINAADAQYLKYFQGSISIPALPYYTTTATQFGQSNYQMNISGMNTIIQDTLQQLAKQLITVAIPEIFQGDPSLQSAYANNFSLTNELNSLDLSYDESQNVNLTNPVNGNEYIVAQTNLPTLADPNPVNKIVLSGGSNLFPDEISESTSPISHLEEMYETDHVIFNDNFSDEYENGIPQMVWNNWVNYDFPAIYAQLMQARWQDKESSVALGLSLMQPLTRPISSYVPGATPPVAHPAAVPSTPVNNGVPGAGQPYGPDVNDPLATGPFYHYWLQNIYPKWLTFAHNFNFISATWDGYGYAIQATQAIPLTSGRAFIPFTIKVIDPTSYFTVMSSNFMRANRATKAILPAGIAQAALQLPLNDPTLTLQMVNSDPAEYANHFIMDPVTHKLVYYQDFLSWLTKLSDRYKITVDSQQYVIIGAGLSPDFMYPTLTSANLLLNSATSGVAYTNSAGFYRSTDGIGATVNHYISIRYPADIQGNIFKEHKILEQLQAFTEKIYGQNEVYKVNNPKQPNQLLYVRMNFSYDLRNVVLVVTVIVGIIIAILSLFFISTLLRSIVKQNKVIFGIVNANGVSKITLATAFFPFAVIPAVICGALGYLIAYFLTPSLTGMVISYWAPDVSRLDCQWWLFIVTPLIVAAILFLLLLAVIMWTIRKRTTELLTESSEFRMNWLIMHINRLTTHLGALGSFRLTYVMGNITRFFVLMAIVIAFITVSGVFVGTIGTFQNALAYTSRNHQYTYAINLYSPTAEGGYYSEIPMTEIGTDQQGLTPLYNTDSNDGFYGSPYRNALQYPYQSNLEYTNLFLPCTSVASQIQGNVQFFKNKIFSEIDLNIDLDLIGVNINPWSFAKSFAPAPVIALSNFDMQHLLTNAFDFFLWVQQNDLYQKFSPTTVNQPWTVNGEPIAEPVATNQNSEWIYLQRIGPNGQPEWYLNPDDLTGAPTYEFYPKVVKLFVDLITITQNPLYQQWAEKKFGTVQNYNYLLGNAVVATEPGDGTYTYLTSSITDVNGQPLAKSISAQIDGIKPNTHFILLYNTKNQIMNDLLTSKCGTQDGQPIYPLVINQVVARKYDLTVGDVITTETTNELDRFILKYDDPTGNNDVKSYFKVVGITSSRSGEAYYTSQADANAVLGYQNPHWASDPGYVPFNGLFTNSPNPDMIYRFGSIYSPSGLSPAIGIWTEHPTGGMAYQLFDSWGKLNSIVKFNLTSGLDNYNLTSASIVLTRLINTFGMKTPIVISVRSAQTRLATTIMGQVMDQTVKNVMTFVTVAFIPTLVIIIVMLGSMIVAEARRLIALLKVLGYGNWSNTFSFLFVYLIVLFLGLGISVGLTYLILFIFAVVSFAVFAIIITPVAPWWIYLATFGVVALIFLTIYVATYFQLRRINPAVEIAVR